jgi:hypothetical protein
MKQDLINGKNDEYYTHEYSIKPILKYVKSGSTVWCPFDPPQSRFVTEFEKHGCKVIRTHIAENGNFFEIDTPECDYIISNPPYSCKAQVFKKLFEIGKPFAMLIGIEGIFGSKERFELFKSNDIEIMYFDTRVKYMNSYDIEGTNTNPPYASAYMCSKLLPKQIVFEALAKKRKEKDYHHKCSIGERM